MPIFRVFLLGAPGFTYGDESYAVDRVQNRALLYRLASNLQPVSRSQLAFLFWPEESNARAQRLLTQLLSHARTALPAPDMLITDKDTVRLNPVLCTSDSATFVALCNIGNTASTENLAAAVALYKGAFLLDASLPDLPEYEAWVTTERNHLEQLYLNVLHLLASAAVGQGQWRRAIDLANRYLSIDELSEDIHRILIESYDAVGDRSAALQQYERCKQVLERELGVSPLPETISVYESVRGLRSSTAPATSIQPLSWATLPGLQTPLVGREEIVDALESLLGLARAGQGQTVLLSGEAGIGKSRLLQEFATRVQTQALVLAASCRPSLQSLPFQPLIEAIRPVLRQPHLVRRVPQVWLRPVYILIPEIEEEADDSHILANGDPERARAILFEALLQIIVHLADEGAPVLVCFDDLHWSDSATLDWLEYLARQVRTHHILLCGTYRIDESEGVADLKWALARIGQYHELPMNELDVHHVCKLLDYLDVPSTGALATLLQTATGGNPFFLLETVQGLVEGGQLSTAQYSLEQIPISASMRETVDHRLSRLQPVTRQVLEAGAVLGLAFSFTAIREIAGRSELETLDGLDELIHRHVLLENNDGYRFNHEVTRSIVYRELSQGRRRVLHRRCAEVLEAGLKSALPSYRAALVAQIGHHFAEAGEPANAVDYLLEAGDHARSLYDYLASIEYYKQVLAALQSEQEPQRAARVFMKLGMTYHVMLDYEAAQAAFNEAFRLHQRTNPFSAVGTTQQAPHPLRIVTAETHPLSLDPATIADHSSVVVGAQIYCGLVQLNAQLDIAPDVAQRWEVLDKGRRYIFHLREDACWSDGTSLTAHDFRFAWMRTLDPQRSTGYAFLLHDIRNARAYNQRTLVDAEQVGVRVIGDHSLEVELETAIPYFLHLLLCPTFFPVPRHIVERDGDAWTLAAQPVTNGAYRPTKWIRSTLISLGRNERYQGVRTGNVEHVHFYSNDDWPAKLRLYQANEMDVLALRDPPTAEMHRARHLLANDYVSLPVLATDFLGFDVRREPFDDSRVRRAFGLALDKDLLANTVLQGYKSPAHGGFVPPGMPGHTSRSVATYSPEVAQRLLQAAGFPNGRGFPEIEWYAGVPEYQPYADFLRDQWRKHLNLDLPYKPTSWEYIHQRLNTAPPHLFIVGWHADYPDPHSFLANGPVQLWCRWHDEIYDWLAADAGASPDQSHRTQIYQQLDRMLLEEGVLFPLTYIRFHMLVKPWVEFTPFLLSPYWFWKDVTIRHH